VSLAPPVVNKDYFLFEFGYVLEKKKVSLNYYYNAYVNIALFEDWLRKSDNLRAGGLGFKGGVFLPTQPWIPLLATLTIGYAKTVLHVSPLLGRNDKIVRQKDMILFEIGALYHYDKFSLRLTYQKTNVNYFERSTFLTLGMNY
jgi:hypothetical protein